MGALSDEAVGKYLDENFVSTFQQVGDFEVVKTEGGVQKNGGNVVSYFCTPEQQVIHAVVGPAEADRFLEAARWSVSLWERVQQADATDRQRLVHKAHLQKAGIEPSAYYEAVSQELPDSIADYQTKAPNWRSYGQRQKSRLPPILQARHDALSHFGKQDDPHGILAARPLAGLETVYGDIFERAANEPLSSTGLWAKLAARGLRKAQSEWRPVLLVIYEGHGEYHRPGEETRKLIHSLADRRRPFAKLLRHYVVVLLAHDQLAAVSSVTDIPLYETGYQPTLILARPDGTPIESFSPYSLTPQTFQDALDRGLARARLRQARHDAAEGNLNAAREMLRGIVKYRAHEGLRERARQFLATLKGRKSGSVALTESGKPNL